MTINTCFISVVYFLCLLVTNSANESENASNNSCVDLYEAGVNAYLENRYEDCTKYLENSLKKYREYKKKLQNCRLKCKYETEISEPLNLIDVDNLRFYETSIKTTLCIVKCKNENPELFANFNLSPESEEVFEEKKPYEYLHLCYYKTKAYQEAANAVFTYLVEHPDNTLMSTNLKYYSKMKDVDMKSLLNFEAKDHVYLYVHGADAYDNENWDKVIQYMEESLTVYLQEEDECRAYCEGPFDPGWFPDFIASISNHFVYCLKCKQKCKRSLNSLNGEYHEDLLQSHYNYLQYAYFQKKELLPACQAVASYLLFDPTDKSMIENMKYYSNLPKVKGSFFTPRKEAVEYVERQTYESKIFDFLKTEFKLTPAQTPHDKETKSKIHIQLLHNNHRALLEEVTTPNQCRDLIYITKVFATFGDGYDGDRSPHNDMETFKGITLNRIASLVYIQLLNRRYLKMYLDITENIRMQVKKVFNVKQKLYFSYTQLVCRSALPSSAVNRYDFSHEIHSDNCNILINGTCLKEPPAYTWRDYSAILYLNNNFNGGEFIFSADPNGDTIQNVVIPKCGRLVTFSSGPENLHGVKALQSKERCALALWFTFNEKYQEIDRPIAHRIINENISVDRFVGVDISNG